MSSNEQVGYSASNPYILSDWLITVHAMAPPDWLGSKMDKLWLFPQWKSKNPWNPAYSSTALAHLFFWVNSSFKVDLLRLSECSEYFRALSQSRMRETLESLIQLDHVPTSIFYHFLEYSFHNRFIVPVAELDAHIQVWGLCESLSGAHCLSHCLFAPLTLEVSSYLLAEAFLSKCLSVLEDELNPDNCWSYLSLAQEICCEQLKRTVFTYMSNNLLEIPHLVT